MTSFRKFSRVRRKSNGELGTIQKLYPNGKCEVKWDAGGKSIINQDQLHYAQPGRK